MKPEIIYLETCQPDYFQGFAGTVFCADAVGRVRDVLESLRWDIHAWDGWIPEASRYATEEEWQAIDRAVKACFRGTPRSRSWARLTRKENDGATAYFGLRWVS